VLFWCYCNRSCCIHCATSTCQWNTIVECSRYVGVPLL
jgi:hypothetical protein